MPTVPTTEDLTQRYTVKNLITGVVVASYAERDDAIRAWQDSPYGYVYEDVHERYEV